MSATSKRSAQSPGTSQSAELALRMESILNAAVDGIIVIDQDGCIELFNRAAEHIFGYGSEEVVGKNVSLLMPQPHRSQHDSHIQQYLRTGNAHIIGIGREVQGQRADGTLFPIDLSVSETRLGDRVSFTGLVRDITERKLLEKAIVDASELERKQLGQDLHDTVSQHLAGLTMLSKVLLTKIESAGYDNVKPDAENISALAATALSQVKSISHGLYPVELERNGLGFALAQLTEQQGSLFSINCVYTGETDVPDLNRSVAMHLYRIAQEGISNAIKHAQASRIEVDLRVNSEKTELRLSVSDDGRGMVTERKQISGLGLAIMQYRANMIGSEVDIHSRIGSGTKICCVCATA